MKKQKIKKRVKDLTKKNRDRILLFRFGTLTPDSNSRVYFEYTKLSKLFTGLTPGAIRKFCEYEISDKSLKTNDKGSNEEAKSDEQLIEKA